MDEAVGFVRDILALRGYRRRALVHAVRFANRYRSTLSLLQITLALGSAGLLCADGLITGRRWGSLSSRMRRRTHITTTEALDPMYTPAFRVASQYEWYFKPTMVTDATGTLTTELAELAVPAAAQPLMVTV
jgi:hypothetical protein